MSSSKRLCISLLHTPRRRHPSLVQCAFQTHPIDHQPSHHGRQPHQRRPFTSSRPSHANSAARQITQPRQTQPSIANVRRRQMEEAQRSGAMLEHLGLLQQTFVPPTSAPLLPSPLTDPRGRLKIEYNRLKNYIFLLQSWITARWNKIPWERRQTPAIARDLFVRMNTAFADGDVGALEGKVSPGMLAQLRNRIAQRPPNHRLSWTLHKHLAPPSVSSYLSIPMPSKDKGAPPTAILQAVIRLRTRQSLLGVQRRKSHDPQTGRMSMRDVFVDVEGHPIEEHLIEKARLAYAKDTTEHVVLQKFVKQGKPGPWHIWGTVEEMGVEKIKEREIAVRKLTMSQKAGGPAAQV